MILDLDPPDLAPPNPGDVLRPGWPKGRAWYVVLEVAPVDSRVHPNRWRVRTRRIRKIEVADHRRAHPDSTVWPVVPRGYGDG